MENKKEPYPFWMPKSTVRAVLAFMAMGTFSYLAVVRVIPVEAVVTVAVIVVKEYFENRRKEA